MRLAPEPAPPDADAGARRRRAGGRAPAGLDAFAVASPFGAALIEGDDPFAGEILEVNAAWAGIAGEAAAPARDARPT